MNIEINTDIKLITIKHSTNVGELVSWMKDHLKGWKDYQIVSENTVNYYPYYPVTPQYEPLKVWCDHTEPMTVMTTN